MQKIKALGLKTISAVIYLLMSSDVAGDPLII